MQTESLEHSIDGRPDFSLLTVALPAGETIMVEASAMATMDPSIKMKTVAKGGVSRILTGESLFINEFTASGVKGQISIAPGAPGDLEHIFLSGESIFLQNSAFVASSPGVKLDTKWQGLVKGFFSGENLFLIKCSGNGDLWFNTFGAMIELDAGENQYLVDTGHIVAFTEGLDYSVTGVGGYKSIFFSGEGLVCRFRGKGKIWIQTRKLNRFASWVHPFRRLKSKKN